MTSAGISPKEWALRGDLAWLFRINAHPGGEEWLSSPYTGTGETGWWLSHLTMPVEINQGETG